MTSMKSQRTGDVLSEIFNRTVEIMSDLRTATAAASMNASFPNARRLIKFQKGATKAGLHVVEKVQDYAENSLRDAIKQDRWLPEEGKEVVDEWSSMMHSGIKEFGHVVDKSFDLMLKYLDSVEKEARNKNTTPTQEGTTVKKPVKKKSASRKTTVKKSTVKKTTTKKPATRKAATKKVSSSKKTTTRKKNPKANTAG